MDGTHGPGEKRLRQSDRRDQILLELKLRPHVRITEMARRFGVSTETVRRDMGKLSDDGLIERAHGGAAAGLTTALVTDYGALKDLDVGDAIARSRIVPDFILPAP